MIAKEKPRIARGFLFGVVRKDFRWGGLALEGDGSRRETRNSILATRYFFPCTAFKHLP
jgi:hypothetical protein